MMTPAESVSVLLADLGGRSTFATRFAVKADPRLHVQGVGKVTLPISVHTAHRLCAAAQPAHHGYRDETRLDPRVRDTWEIPAEHIRFDSPQWRSVFDRALKRIGHDLGLSSDAGLKAELHNLLVYAPGQFFAVHQDSEKVDGMVGTLVITLPSDFVGGEFAVSHAGRTLRSRGSANQLEMVAFYADCHHEVRLVEQGYRVVLTYNLIASGDSQPADVPEQDLAALAQEVDRFWQTPVPPRWSDDRVEPPDRLVYLLDHQYTERGLSWTRLKELVDSEIELRHWLACDGSEAVSNATRVETEELCFTRDSADCVGEPGNTLAQFLESPVRRRFEWPLAEPRRRIVHQLIDRHELPVRHETRRTGRPYTLVLDKTGALFERAAADRREWASELAWLQQTKGGFGRREM